jgi:hypothetical protein
MLLSLSDISPRYPRRVREIAATAFEETRACRADAQRDCFAEMAAIVARDAGARRLPRTPAAAAAKTPAPPKLLLRPALAALDDARGDTLFAAFLAILDPTVTLLGEAALASAVRAHRPTLLAVADAAPVTLQRHAAAFSDLAAVTIYVLSEASGERTRYGAVHARAATLVEAAGKRFAFSGIGATADLHAQLLADAGDLHSRGAVELRRLCTLLGRDPRKLKKVDMINVLKAAGGRA